MILPDGRSYELSAELLKGAIDIHVHAGPHLPSSPRRVDPFEVGGGPLLGVNGVVTIGHGRSNALAIKNTIGQARKAVQGGVVEAIRQGLTKEQA